MATASSTGCRTLTFSFFCGLREYHEYRCNALNKVPPAKHARKTIGHDQYAKSLVICLEKFIGSRTVNIIIVCGEVVTCTARVFDVKHRRLFNEVLRLATVVLEQTDENKQSPLYETLHW